MRFSQQIFTGEDEELLTGHVLDPPRFNDNVTGRRRSSVIVLLFNKVHMTHEEVIKINLLCYLVFNTFSHENTLYGLQGFSVL